MANESTFSDISSLLGSIYETAIISAKEAGLMPQLVRVFGGNGNQPRIWSNYSGGTFATVTEATDMSAQTFNAAVGGTLTPAIYGSQVFITDARIASDKVQVQQDAGIHLGGKAGEDMDANLAGLFASLTGGTVGTAGGTLTWANVLRAQAYLRANKVQGPYFAVIRPEQWYYLTSASSGVPTLMQNGAIADSIMGGFYQASFAGINFFVDANIASGTACVGGMFGRDAIALDIRKPFQIEPQRDASRGGGGWELNATLTYAYGVYRPTFGAKMIGTSS